MAEAGRQVVEAVHAHGAFLVGDDWAHDFGITTTPVPLAAGDDSGHVVHLRSLTMIVSPALRVGAVIARGPVRERILAEHTPQAHVEHAPPGGVNLGARLPGGVDVLQLAQDCERAGVVIAAGTERFPADPTGPYIRLNYSETDPASFLRGARVLGGALGHAQG